MIVRCPSCEKSYVVDDDLIENGRLVRCFFCSTTWFQEKEDKPFFKYKSIASCISYIKIPLAAVVCAMLSSAYIMPYVRRHFYKDIAVDEFTFNVSNSGIGPHVADFHIVLNNMSKASHFVKEMKLLMYDKDGKSQLIEKPINSEINNRKRFHIRNVKIEPGMYKCVISL